MGFSWSYWGLTRAHAAGVEPHEVIHALRGHAWPRRLFDPLTNLTTLVFWGQGENRHLKVYTRQVGERDWEIFDAQDMTPAETTEYQQWRKNHGE